MRTKRSTLLVLATAAITMAAAGPAAATADAKSKRKQASCAKATNVALCKALRKCNRRYARSRTQRGKCRADAKQRYSVSIKPPVGAPPQPQPSPGSGDVAAPVVDPPAAPPVGLKVVSLTAPAVVEGLDPFTTTIVIRNDGPTPASQVEIDLTNEGGASKATFDPGAQVTGGACIAIDTFAACGIDELAAGAQATATVPAKSKCAGPFALRADVKSNTADPNTADNTARTTVATTGCG